MRVAGQINELDLAGLTFAGLARNPPHEFASQVCAERRRLTYYSITGQLIAEVMSGRRPSRACAMSQAMISALSSIEPSRPERPLWPAVISVLNTRSRVSVLVARNFATHLAGSA